MVLWTALYIRPLISCRVFCLFLNLHAFVFDSDVNITPRQQVAQQAQLFHNNKPKEEEA